MDGFVDGITWPMVLFTKANKCQQVSQSRSCKLQYTTMGTNPSSQVTIYSSHNKINTYISIMSSYLQRSAMWHIQMHERKPYINWLEIQPVTCNLQIHQTTLPLSFYAGKTFFSTKIHQFSFTMKSSTQWKEISPETNSTIYCNKELIFSFRKMMLVWEKNQENAPQNT